MSKYIRMNDGSSQPPRLAVYQSMWAMTHIPGIEHQWTLTEQIARIREAGFSGVLALLPQQPEDEKLLELFHDNELEVAAYCYPWSVEGILPLLKRAKQLGVKFLNAQVGSYFLYNNDAVKLLRELCQVSLEYGVPLFVETHRGSVTQDIIRTIDYVEKVADIGLTIDLSHYVVAGEVLQPSSCIEDAFDKILKHTSSIHGRISNGEQIQVDMGGFKSGISSCFCSWWKKGMAYWASGAVAGDVLPFVVELGPIPYGIAHTEKNSPYEYREIYDRWEQALAIKEIAIKLWSSL